MSGCCDPSNYRRFFNTKEAKRRAKAYGKRGLDKRAVSILEFLTGRGVADSDVLEVGGGIGDFEVELLKAGASSAVNVELSNAYENAATELAAANDMAERMSFVTGDFVDIAETLDPADIVILNRVVCCYPWLSEMMRAATGRTRRYLGLVFPNERLAAKGVVAVGNGFLALRRCGFRTFVHPVDRIFDDASEAGLSPVHDTQDLVWRSVVWERAA